MDSRTSQRVGGRPERARRAYGAIHCNPVEVPESLRLRDVVSIAVIVCLSFPVAGVTQQPQAAPEEPPKAQQPTPSQPPPPAKPEKGGMSGIAGGLGAAPQHDAQNRPITAGGF